MLLNKYFVQFFVISLLFIGAFSVNSVFASSDSKDESKVESNAEAIAVEDSVESSSDRGRVLATFVGGDRGELVESFDERRDQHQILFFMGVLLLISILLTAGFGVSMAMLGKEVFVPHMIFAGISVFLSIAHAVVAIVWFFPF